MTKWVNRSRAKIVVVSNELATDELMLEIYLLQPPAGEKWNVIVSKLPWIVLPVSLIKRETT